MNWEERDKKTGKRKKTKDRKTQRGVDQIAQRKVGNNQMEKLRKWSGSEFVKTFVKAEEVPFYYICNLIYSWSVVIVLQFIWIVKEKQVSFTKTVIYIKPHYSSRNIEKYFEKIFCLQQYMKNQNLIFLHKSWVNISLIVHRQFQLFHIF